MSGRPASLLVAIVLLGAAGLFSPAPRRALGV